MKIITAPHHTLRATAQYVNQVTPELKALVQQLGSTLENITNPRGVGLAAPQVNHSQRLFATFIAQDNTDTEKNAQIQVYINPEITAHSDDYTFGPDKKHPTLEGCLSIPGYYGPVPRWEWIELQFSVIQDEVLQKHSRRFTNFGARVIQHELDHLNGILFTDYSLEYDLPVYHEDKKTGQLEEVENSQWIELF
jgi:peptide deformylase